MQAISKDEAKALLAASAYTLGNDPNSRRYGDPEPAADTNGEVRTVIHTVIGMLRGEDMDLAAALAHIDEAEQVGWEPHIVGHDLAATAAGRTVRFDISHRSHRPIPLTTQVAA